MSRFNNVRKREFEYSKVLNNGRVDRVLKLIVFLSEFRTISQCSEHLNVSKKTISRMFNLLHSVGFEFETNFGRCYATRITNTKSFFDIK
jgi:predicted DNA-binding transcriptional regulator YafY